METSETELFIALVAAVGTDIAMVSTELETELNEYDFTTHCLRLSDFLAELSERDFRDLPFDERLSAAMDAGNELRRTTSRGDALALAAISDIVVARQADAPPLEEGAEQPENLERTAFIVRSLKTVDELDALRAVYGPRLFVIAAYSPESHRLEHLSNEIRDSRREADSATWMHQPQDLVERDMDEQDQNGQNVADTFHRADFFIRGTDREATRTDVQRTLEIIFGHPFHTPTAAEHAQFVAAGEARRSSELGRQVGAAIVDASGAIIALGTNEVPVAGGGSFREGEDRPDNREFALKSTESNNRHQRELAGRITQDLMTMFDAEIESLELDPEDGEALRGRLVQALPDRLLDAGLKEITEFGRAVHAEMDALLDAARRGVSIQGCVVYTTTFPCHNCARHLIAAGISRVVFVEPYEKSKAPDLHDDSIALDLEAAAAGKVVFEPFVGVAPRRYLDSFDASARERLAGQRRKASDGSVAVFDKKTAVPLFIDLIVPAELRPALAAYRLRELIALRQFDDMGLVS